MLTPQQEFIDAIYFDRLKAMAYLLYWDIDIESIIPAGVTVRRQNANDKVRSNYTPLLWATQFHSIDSVERLLKHGANVNAQLEGFIVQSSQTTEEKSIEAWLVRKMETPLMLAIQRKDLEMVKLLLQYGADTNIYNEGDQLSALCYASCNFPEAIQLLIDYGANVNAECPFDCEPDDNAGLFLLDKNPLSCAVDSACADSVKILLANGAYIGIEERIDTGYVYAAIKSGCPEVLKLMLDLHSVFSVEQMLWFYFTEVIDTDNLEVTEVLLDYCVKNNLEVMNALFLELFQEQCSPAMLKLLRQSVSVASKE